MKNGIKYILFFLFCLTGLNDFAQVTTFLWSGYVRATNTPIGATDYNFNLTCLAPAKTVSVTANITSSAGTGIFNYPVVNMANAQPPLYSNSIDPYNTGSGCAPYGLVVGLDWANKTSDVTITINFNVNYIGVIGPVTFSIFDLNNQSNGSGGAYFEDMVDITAIKNPSTAVTPSVPGTIPGNNSTGGGGCTFGWSFADCNGGASTAGNTLTLKGNGFNGDCTNWANEFITVGTSSDIIEQVKIKYYSGGTTSSNGTTQANPAQQYIVISSLATGGVCNALIVLPVELTYFAGKCNGTKKILSWETATENNNKNFTVEHSRDGVSFEEMGIVNGNGNSLRKINYEYSFSEETPDYNYYRLKQTDLNGATKTLKTIYLSCVDKMGKLKLFPNPATNQIKLAFESTEETTFTINITDIAGRVVRSIQHDAMQGGNEVSLQVDDLPGGLYNVVIGDVNGISRTQTLKFIKSNE